MLMSAYLALRRLFCEGTKSESATTDESPPLVYAHLLTWSANFGNLMQNSHGQKYFAEFLKSEYSDENILFWQACEELKRERNPEKLEEKARIIYEDFISILSPKEVSLDSRVREKVNENMARPSASTFNEAQSVIYNLMARDSYPRYISSPAFRELMREKGGIIVTNSTDFSWTSDLPTFRPRSLSRALDSLQFHQLNSSDQLHFSVFSSAGSQLLHLTRSSSITHNILSSILSHTYNITIQYR
ncbi:unnamed protein product [Caenorhabditis sp. 36 PRJEB53466]|nr:unnamed protein product [Caenorhabditis sp. 36 PRJEB53466]